MRILVVQESDWLKRGPHQNHHLMERLSTRGHEVRVIDFEILWKEGGDSSLISKRLVFSGVHKAMENGDVSVIRPAIIRVQVLDYLSLICTHYMEIIRQIEEFKPDAIIGFGILNANIAIRLARGKGIPFIYYVIDELHRLVPQKCFQGLARSIESQNIRNADKVISINEGLREYTILMGADRYKTDVVRAGVDLDRFRSANGEKIRAAHGIGERDIVVFFMGWLYDFSGLKEVALSLTKPENNRFKLLILGEGDLWDEIQKIKRVHDLEDRIVTVGWRPYEEVPKYLAASDICILPAYNNDIMKNIVPIKMYEYMAAQKPVIASRLYGIIKEFGHDSGVTYVDRPEDILSAATQLVNDCRLEECGYRAFEFVEKNDWGNLVAKFEDILKDLTGAGAKSSSQGLGRALAADN